MGFSFYIMKYYDKLKDPLWKIKRAEILKRDNNECRKCQITTGLQVHHTLYIKGKEPWEYHNNLLMTLCENCHKDYENELDKIKFALAYVQQVSNLEAIRVLIQRHVPNDFFNEYANTKFAFGGTLYEDWE